MSVTATFPSRPPSRAAIAWAMPDTLRLRRGLDELSKGAWTPESQSRRAALVAALWALDESIRHPGLLWRSSDRDAGARVAEGDIPGLLQVIPPPSIHHRTITAGMCFAALALLLSSVVVTGVQSEQSSQLARRGPADIPVSPQSGAPVGENPPATEAPESAAPAHTARRLPIRLVTGCARSRAHVSTGARRLPRLILNVSLRFRPHASR